MVMRFQSPLVYLFTRSCELFTSKLGVNKQYKAYAVIKCISSAVNLRCVQCAIVLSQLYLKTVLCDTHLNHQASR